jgi:hypothetical protein
MRDRGVTCATTRSIFLFVAYPHQGQRLRVADFSFIAMANTTDIRAIRDGKINHFHPNTWANMPEDKYGWQEIKQASAPPPVVVEAMASVEKKIKEVEEKRIDAMAKLQVETKRPRAKRAK